MKALITGGNSYIGNRLARRLIAAGYDVRIAGRAVNPEFAANTVHADVTDEAAMNEALAGMEVVFHLAAEHRGDVRAAERYYRTNVGGMEVLCKAAGRHGVRKIVFTSSIAVYGLDIENVTEAQRPNPVTDYGRSKLQAEHVLRQWQKVSPGRSIAIVRPCPVFGPGNQSNVHALLDQIMKRRFLMIGPGTNRRSMAYVENLVDALIFMANQPSLEIIVNYADKPDLNMQELVATICKAAQMDIPRIWLPVWLGLLAGYGFDVLSKLTGRHFPIGAARVRSFCAESIVKTEKIESMGFVRNCTLLNSVYSTVKDEILAASRGG